MNSPNWRPRPPYPDDWLELAEAARARTCRCCTSCGKQCLVPAKYWQLPPTEAPPLVLEVHHRDGNPANSDPDNLQRLCRRCHQKQHRSDRAEAERRAVVVAGQLALAP